MKPNRFFSKRQEDKVAKAVGGKRQPNSGATTFAKGDVIDDNTLFECKTKTSPGNSHTIKKDWFTKNQEEAFSRGKRFSVITFDFGDGENYYTLREDDFVELYEAWKKVTVEGIK